MRTETGHIQSRYRPRNIEARQNVTQRPNVVTGDASRVVVCVKNAAVPCGVGNGSFIGGMRHITAVTFDLTQMVDE